MSKKIGDAKQQHTLDPLQMAATAYYSMVEQVVTIQQRMAQRAATKAMFGDKALPLTAAFRTGRSILSTATKQMAREEEHDRECLEELLSHIAEMEPIFKGHSDENMRRFVYDMVRRYQEDSKPG